jgi:hypothetical protein
VSRPVLVVVVEIPDPSPTWRAEDPRRAALRDEKACDVVLDTVVEALDADASARRYVRQGLQSPW